DGFCIDSSIEVYLQNLRNSGGAGRAAQKSGGYVLYYLFFKKDKSLSIREINQLFTPDVLEAPTAAPVVQENLDLLVSAYTDASITYPAYYGSDCIYEGSMSGNPRTAFTSGTGNHKVVCQIAITANNNANEAAKTVELTYDNCT